MGKQTQYTIKLTAYDRQRAEKFATARCGEDQSLYHKRGGFKREDVLCGALGEIAAYKLLRENDFKVNKPDFTIHEKGRKSYAADLQDGKRHFHVKAQTLSSEEKYGSSWLLQRKDKLLTKEQKSHYVIPCTVNMDTNEVTIFCVANIETVKKNDMIGECKLLWFRRDKVALYWDDIRKLSYNSRWSVLKR